LKLTQGLLPASKVQDGPDNSVTSRPDENGGFEFGTWGIKKPWECLGKLEMNIRPAGECSFGVQCCHKFTPEQCQKIVEHLKTYERVEEITEVKQNGAVVKNEVKVGYVSPTKDDNHLEEWYNRLIELFSNTEDPPVYYWAD
jgi:hypothetical protein